MTFTLVQLETFARLVEIGNFTRVARELHLTQPAVTQQVRALERHFKVRLVDVIGRRPVLTDAGRFLATRTRDLLAGAEALEREMAEYSAVRSGELVLGATLTIGAYALPPILASFAARYPGVSVHVNIANTESIAERMRAGSLGVALVEGPLLHEEAFDVVPFADDRLLLVAPPGHPLAARGSVRPQDLQDVPFVWRERGSGTRALAEHALREAGVRPRTALELPSGEGVARAVESGLGVAILSELVVERAVAQGRLVAVDIEGLDLRRTFRVISPRGRTLSPSARALTSVLEEQIPVAPSV